MHCSRLDHFRRIMATGKIGLCGHMVNSSQFDSLPALEESEWLASIKNDMHNDRWPAECKRCKLEESLGQQSIRQKSNERDLLLNSVDQDYLIVGGILDNICNSACQFCDETLSTKIGSLIHGKNYNLTDNMEKFKSFPQDKIVELDINGGEPSNSPNYKKLLESPPPNVKVIRINTNASLFIDSIESLLQKGITVIVTISLDGTGKIYEYARWPLKWDRFESVVNQYKQLKSKYKNLKLNFWTTVSVYVVGDLPNIIEYADSVGIEISFGILDNPIPLRIQASNYITELAKEMLKETTVGSMPLYNIIASEPDNTDELLSYITHNDKLRGTNYEDCYNRA